MVHHVKSHVRNGHRVRSYTRRDPRRSTKSAGGPTGLILFVVFLFGLGALAVQGKSDGAQSQQKASWTADGVEYRPFNSDVTDSCAGLAYGKIEQFLSTHPCTELARTLFYGVPNKRSKAAVSVSWTTMRTSDAALQLRQLVDRHGTGNLTELTDGRKFTGTHYASKVNGKTVVIAQAEPVTGQLNSNELDHIATTALGAPRP